VSEPVSMREAFGQALVEIGRREEKLVVLDADVSNSTRTRLFGEAFPDRFFNCGVAEQNMVGVAAGLATMGLIPVASSFAFLISLRAAEQVRTSVAYPRLNVKLAGGYCGLSDSKDGPTHQSVMDVAVMRSMPNMRVVCPSDGPSTRRALEAIVADEGPWYLRTSRADVPTIAFEGGEFRLGKGRIVKHLGGDCLMLATGPVVASALGAQQWLADHGMRTIVAEIHTLKPIDHEFIVRLAERTGSVVTIEEHSVIGGLGSAVAEVLAGRSGVRLSTIGLRDTFAQSGDVEELYRAYGLDAESISRAVETFLRRKP